MFGKTKARLIRSLSSFGFDLVMYQETQDGRFAPAWIEDNRFVYEVMERGSVIPEKVKYHISHEEAEALYAALDEYFNPPEASATKQKLDAVTEHLSAVTRVLDFVLPSAIRERAETFQAKRAILAEAMKPYSSEKKDD